MPKADPAIKAKMHSWIGECDQRIARSVQQNHDTLMKYNVSVVLHPRLNGTIESIAIAKSSGFANIDDLVVSLIKQAAPFSPCSINLISKQGVLVVVNNAIVSTSIAPARSVNELIQITAPYRVKTTGQ